MNDERIMGRASRSCYPKPALTATTIGFFGTGRVYHCRTMLRVPLLLLCGCVAVDLMGCIIGVLSNLRWLHVLALAAFWRFVEKCLVLHILIVPLW